METYSGIAFNLRDPDPLQVNVIDIAHHLAAFGRYCGAAKSFYSVAQHSVLVSRLVWRQTKSHQLAKAALLHDAHEAYIGDWTRPLCEAYPELKPIRRRIALRLDLAIAKAFGIDAGDFHHPIVIDADNSTLMAEANELMPSKGEGWDLAEWDLADVKRAEVRIILPLSPHNAEIYFLDAWRVMQ